MNKKFLIKLTNIFLIGFFLLPVFTNAFEIYTNNDSANTGEFSTVKIFIDTKGLEINVLEGELDIIGPASISKINTEASIFNLWTEKPVILSDKNIKFTGGVAGGVYGKDLRLFDILIKRNGKGKIEIKPKNVFAYVNDGMGTKVKFSEPNSISIEKILNITLVMVILFTFINILKKFTKR